MIFVCRNLINPTSFVDELKRDDTCVVFLLGMRKKFDAVVGDITIVASRANYVDFSLPYTDSGVTMLVPIKHNMQHSMWVFLKPLSLDLWLTTIAASIATGIVLLILEHGGRRESLQPLELLSLILWFPFSSLVLPESKPSMLLR